MKSAIEAKNIKIVVIGIGSELDESACRNLVSSPSDFYKSETFDDLLAKDFVQKVSLCGGKTGGKKEIDRKGK